MRKKYRKPQLRTQPGFETSALSCGKTTDPPAGSWHFGGAYDTFTGHFAGGMGVNETVSGTGGLGFGPGGTSNSYAYSGLCGNWVTYSS